MYLEDLHPLVGRLSHHLKVNIVYKLVICYRLVNIYCISMIFIGDEHCFLFQLKPTMAIYFPTNFNENYMYLNVGMKTLPNGLVRKHHFMHSALLFGKESLLIK